MDTDTEINRVEDAHFKKALDNVIAESEDIRLRRMKQHRTRSFIALNMNILFALIGVTASGWFFLMRADLLLSFLSLIVSLVPSVFFNIWTNSPLKTYKREHKTVFMPKLAKALNGLHFHPERGVSAKIIEKLAVIPAHDEYLAEDCFMGRYKGVKVIFSEARLFAKKRHDKPVFSGIFVLLETPEAVIDGHTIVTANQKMVKAYAGTRWKTMTEVSIPVSDPDWDKFTVYSTKPEAAELMIGERFLKELAEAGKIFDNAQLTAVLFRKKYVFLMIPYAQDMFEASNLFVPVTTKTQAMKCKKEIEQLLEIVDIFDLYQPVQSD